MTTRTSKENTRKYKTPEIALRWSDCRFIAWLKKPVHWLYWVGLFILMWMCSSCQHTVISSRVLSRENTEQKWKKRIKISVHETLRHQIQNYVTLRNLNVNSLQNADLKLSFSVYHKYKTYRRITLPFLRTCQQSGRRTTNIEARNWLLFWFSSIHFHFTTYS
jgi:hypothetical protein